MELLGTLEQCDLPCAALGCLVLALTSGTISFSLPHLRGLHCFQNHDTCFPKELPDHPAPIRTFGSVCICDFKSRCIFVGFNAMRVAMRSVVFVTVLLCAWYYYLFNKYYHMPLVPYLRLG